MQIAWLATLGRIVMGLYFLAAGFNKIMNPGAAEPIEIMTGAGIPWPDLMFTLAAVCETTAGICLVIGLHVRLVSFLLALFVVFVSTIFHAFWTLEGKDAQIQMMMFLKNIGTASGLLAFTGLGGGPLSIDRRFGA
jgi:putative oxidoreductase